MANQPPHGTRRAHYASEMERYIADGMPVSKAAAKVGKEQGIAPGTAHAALYEQRRKQSGRPPARRTTGHYSAPAELQPLLDELAETQANLDRLIKQVVLYAQEQERSLDQRALALIRKAAS